jgi:PIN domain nuclease of toxin-antitoxin system
MKRLKRSWGSAIEVRLLIDTAVLIYAVESPERLSRRATSILEKSTNTLELSAVSLSEIAIKTALGKLRVPASTARRAIDDLGIRVLPFVADHGFRLFELPLLHSDPFDRQIIAQALFEKIAVVSPDEKFSLYHGLKVIW